MEPTTVASAAVESTTVKSSAMESTAVEEYMSARVPCRCCMQAMSCMGRRMPGETSAVRVAKVVAVHSSRMKIINGRVAAVSICDVSIYDGSTVGDERLVVIYNRAMMPVASPVVPTPTVASK
jgi:DTW domain-containing protein YfiP